MKYELTLPENYRLIADMDLQKNKKLMLIVNGIALLIALAMAVPMLFVVPIHTLFEGFPGMDGSFILVIKALVAFLALVVYTVLHELVHGICMKAITKTNPRYGFTGMYAYAAADAYFGKAAYLTVALAPVVLWGIILTLILPFVPTSWFWVVYFVQMQNISGAAGDLYVTCRLSRMPRDILVWDSGVAMKVYSKENA